MSESDMKFWILLNLILNMILFFNIIILLERKDKNNHFQRKIVKYRNVIQKNRVEKICYFSVILVLFLSVTNFHQKKM